MCEASRSVVEDQKREEAEQDMQRHTELQETGANNHDGNTDSERKGWMKLKQALKLTRFRPQETRYEQTSRTIYASSLNSL